MDIERSRELVLGEKTSSDLLGENFDNVAVFHVKLVREREREELG